MNTILELKNVIKYFGNGEAVSKALDGVSFTMEQREFTAVMGASGSGKSTLLNVIATIDNPSSGSILLEGRNIAEMKEKELAAFRRTASACRLCTCIDYRTCPDSGRRTFRCIGQCQLQSLNANLYAYESAIGIYYSYGDT